MSSSRADSERVELVIEAMAHGGEGLARHQGRVVFVPGTLIGDRVLLELPLDARRRFFRVERCELQQASAHRRPARCPHRPRCGGCPWHELDPLIAARAKADSAIEQLQRIGGVQEHELDWPLATHTQAAQAQQGRWILRPALDTAYRLRARFAIARRGRAARAGFYQNARHALIDVEHCELLHPQLAAPTLSALALARRERWPDGELHVALGLDPEQASASLVLRTALHLNRAAQIHERLLDAGFASAELVTGPVARRRRLAGELHALRGVIAGGERGGPYTHDVRCFSQAHDQGNRLLLDAMMAMLGPGDGRRVVELHAGAGNLTLPLALRGFAVRAFEHSGPALDHLRDNAQRAGKASAIDAHAVDVEVPGELLGLLPREADLLLLDPPRSGYRPLSALLKKMPARQVLYVSCDPATLARDVASLVEQGYVARSIALVDLMPQSWHVETLLLLERA